MYRTKLYNGLSCIMMYCVLCTFQIRTRLSIEKGLANLGSCTVHRIPGIWFFLRNSFLQNRGFEKEYKLISHVKYKEHFRPLDDD